MITWENGDGRTFTLKRVRQTLMTMKAEGMVEQEKPSPPQYKVEEPQYGSGDTITKWYPLTERLGTEGRDEEKEQWQRYQERLLAYATEFTNKLNMLIVSASIVDATDEDFIGEIGQLNGQWSELEIRTAWIADVVAPTQRDIESLKQSIESLKSGVPLSEVEALAKNFCSGEVQDDTA